MSRNIEYELRCHDACEGRMATRNRIELTALDEAAIFCLFFDSKGDAMSIGSIFSWAICGLVVGLCARFLVPGRQSMSLVITTMLGIAGALVGGFLYSILRGESVEPFSQASHNWYGWIVAILGATLLVWAYPYVYPRKWWQ